MAQPRSHTDLAIFILLLTGVMLAIVMIQDAPAGPGQTFGLLTYTAQSDIFSFSTGLLPMVKLRRATG